jgi:hypothetical protein
MFGIGSQQDDILEEQYRLKYLKYKEKYLKLKQSGGFGAKSFGIYCLLLDETTANTISGDVEKLRPKFTAITQALHDKAYAIKDGSNEAELIVNTSSIDSVKNLFSNKEKKEETKIKNVKKINIMKDGKKLNIDRCDMSNVNEIVQEIKKSNSKLNLSHIVVINLELSGSYTLVTKSRPIPQQENTE